MAKQNFLSGGFKGKLGEVIGQGWKDQLILRTAGKYTPSNSERQKEIRSSFQLRVLASKMATQANWRAAFFEDGHSGRWGARMKTCSQLFSVSKNIIEYCPVIPYGYTPAYTTSEAPEVGGQNMALIFDTDDDISARQLSVLVWAQNQASGEYDIQLCVANISGEAGNWEANATLPTGYVFGDDSYLVAVSRSDELFNGKTLYQPPVKVGKGMEIRTFTLSDPAVWGFATGDQSYAFELKPNITLPTTANIAPQATARGVLQGEWDTANSLGWGHINDNTVYIYDFENLDSLKQRPMFVTGSWLKIKRFSFIHDDIKYKYAGGTFNLAETPTQQWLYTPEADFDYATSHGLRKINSGTGWTTAGNGSVALRTVWGGDPSTPINFPLSLVQRSDGLYIRLSLDENEYYYGTEQTKTFTSTLTATKNGVTYTLDGDEPMMFNPMKYSEEGTMDFTDAGDWIVNTIEEPDVLQNWGTITDIYTLIIDLASYKPDVVNLTIDGQTYETTLKSFEYDGTDPTENSLLQYDIVGNLPLEPTTATYKVAWTQERTYDYTVPNSGGFTFHIHFPEKTYEGNASIWL